MKKLIFNTDANWASTILRVTFGIIMLVHATGKLGSEGYQSFMYFFTEYLHMPVFLGWLTIAVEVLGSIFLIIGFATRLSAISLFGLFVGMIVFVHWEYGFLMNWSGQLEAGQEGFEYHILVLAICGTLIVLGGGRYSLDHLIQHKI